MQHTRKRAGLLKSALLGAATLGALSLAGAGVARANVVEIGYAGGGYSTTPGATPPPATQVSGSGYSTDSTLGTASFNGSFDGVSASIDSGIGSPTNPLPTLTATLNVTFGTLTAGNTSTTPHIPPSENTVYVYVTETGLTAPVGSYGLASAFSTTTTKSGIAYVTESTFIDQSNTAFGMATSVKSRTFGTGSGTIGGAGSGSPNVFDTPSSLTSPYSLTEVFEVQALVPSTKASIGGTISTSAVPEPGSLALLGTGLLGLGLVVRRRRHKA